MYDCIICYCPYPGSDMKKLEGCDHQFCKGCFKETFRSMIEDQNKFDKLQCPEQGCKATPSQKEIKRILGSKESYLKYKKFNQ